MDLLTNYFKGDSLAAEVWLNKYATEGEVTPDDMHKRMAKEYTRIERKYLNSREATFGMIVDKLSDYGKERFSNLYMSGFPEDHYYNLMKNFEYIIPGGSIMANLGLNTPTSLSNCFVLGQPDDTIESIFNYARDAAQLYKRRGGVGMDLSLLRPRFSKVNNASSTSTGSVSFAELYSKTTSLIGQDGRRGALMLSLDVRHPDILDFIKCKEDLTKINSANISVKVNAEFMKAVLDNTDYILRFPVDTNIEIPQEFNTIGFEELEYDKLFDSDCGKKYVKKVKARELWEELIKHAHGSAEPGILFWDNHLDMDPSAVYPKHKPISTNPCGEIPLPPKDSCRLSAANLYSLVNNAFGPTAHINEDTLYAVFYEQLVMSDNLIDLETEAIDRILTKIQPNYKYFRNTGLEEDRIFLHIQSEEFKLWWEVREMGLSSRRVGNGFTALGDMFAALGFTYGDKQSKDAIERVMYLKEKAELDATIDLALFRGKFKDFDKEKENSPYFYRISQIHPKQYERMQKYGRRNISWSTVAPTGTVSLMARTTSGIEPLFKPYYTRRVKDENGSYLGADGNLYKEYLVVHSKLQEWFIQRGGTVDQLESYDTDTWQVLYEHSPYFKACAGDIAWQDRLEIQAIIQQFTTHSISSTLNLPAETTTTEVNEIYLEAYRLGLKGITIYRDGCRDGVLVDSSAKSTTSSLFEEVSAPKRPKQLHAHLYQKRVKGISYIVAVGIMEEKPYEIFCQQNKEDFDYSKFEQGIIYKVKRGIYEYQSFDTEGNLVLRLPLQENTLEEKTNALFLSMLLRHRAPVSEVIKVAKKIDDNISSFISAICRVLSKYVAKTEVKGEVCPDCGSKLLHEAGCVKCTSCTYSKCLFIYSPNHED